MKASWKIGRVAGIDVYAHATFLILLGWVGLSHYLQRQRWEDALSGLGFIIALFAIVVLHELGHALLAMRMDYARATNVAADIGQGMAWVFGFIGLFTNPFLVFIALFVWMGAAQEASQAQMKSALAGLPVGGVMITEFQTLAPDDQLARAVDHVLAGCQQDFPVVVDGGVVGVLTRADLLTGLARNGQLATVGEVMHRKFCTAESTEMVENVWSRLQEDDCRTIPVVQNGKLIGMLTSENLGEYFMIQAALNESQRGQRRNRAPTAMRREPQPQ